MNRFKLFGSFFFICLLMNSCAEVQESTEHQCTDFPSLPQNYEIFLYAVKETKNLHVFLVGAEKEISLLQTIPFCVNSGVLGPKRKQGDRQIPEGWYFIDRFNPNSRFHLSMGINYPNSSDLYRTTFDDPGDNIFIHGGCQSIGCISIGDDPITWLYGACENASNSRNIPVLIAPKDVFSYRDEDLNGSEHSELWNEIYLIQKAIENKKRLPTVEIQNGSYQLAGEAG